MTASKSLLSLSQPVISKVLDQQHQLFLNVHQHTLCSTECRYILLYVWYAHIVYFRNSRPDLHYGMHILKFDDYYSYDNLYVYRPSYICIVIFTGKGAKGIS